MMHRIFAGLIYLILITLLVTGCLSAVQPAEPTATVIPFPTFTATSTAANQPLPPLPPSPPPPAAPTPPPPAAAIPPPPVVPTTPRTLLLLSPLPAPLYYLDEAGQIQRVVGAPPDYTVEQVTHEAAPITDFDISPVHGRLVFVTDDYRDLVEFDPATQQRVVKLADLDRTIPPNGIDSHTKLRAPRYSPDGTQISFAYNGINLIASSLNENKPSTLLQADNYSVDTDGKMTNVGALRVYQEATWSPNGAYLLLRVGILESTGYELYNLETNTLSPVNQPAEQFYLSAGDWAWERDGQSGYVASADMRGYGPGLFRFDFGQGITTQLSTTLPSAKDTFFPAGLLPRGVHEMPSGALYLFLSMKDSLDLYQLYQLTANTPPVRMNETPVTIAGEVLWSPDGRGALVVTERGSDDWQYPLGPVQWIAPDGAVYLLSLNGHHLRWGATQVAKTTVSTQAMSTE